MKKVRTLTEKEISTLTQGYKQGSHHAFRIRCHIVLLSYSNMSASQIAAKLDKNIKTVYATIEKYNTGGYESLSNKAGQGRVCPLNELSKAQIKYLQEAVDAHPENLNQVVPKLVKEFGFHISKRMLIAYLSA